MASNHPHSSKYSNEGGSALVYILIAIALLAALTFTFMEPSGQQTSSQNTVKTVTELQGQIDTIRAALQECVLSYPKGENSIALVLPDARTNYPIDPSDDYYIDSELGPEADRYVRNIRCPGQRDGPDVNDHAPLFGGKSGRFLGPPPSLFEEWQYYNGADGVFFWTFTTSTDAFLVTALTKLDENFSECEADVVTAGADLEHDSAAVCPADAVCFRVRMTITDEAVWDGDADDDEDSCRP